MYENEEIIIGGDFNIRIGELDGGVRWRRGGEMEHWEKE